MPGNVRRGDEVRYVSTSAELDAAIAEGFAPEGDITFTDAEGRNIQASPDEVANLRRSGAQLESAGSAIDRNRQRQREVNYGSTLDKVQAFGEEGLSALTLGLSDVGLSEEERIARVGRREENPIASMAGAGVGLVATAGLGGGKAALATPMGLLERAAVKAGARAGGGLRGAAVREGIAGAGAGVGVGISETALSDDPITLEGAISNISSSALFGGGLGVGGGILGKAAEKGLARASRGVREQAAKRAVGRAAGQPVEGATQWVDDLKAFRKDVKKAGDLFPVTGKAAKGSELFEAGGRNKSALRSLDKKILDVEETAAMSPWKAREALAKQRKSMNYIVENMESIRADLITDGAKPGGRRLTALEGTPELLERNRALSATMENLDQAGKLANQPQPEGFGEKMLTGAAFGGVMGVSAELGLPSMLGIPVAAGVSGRLGRMAFGRLSKAASKTEQRMSAALERFLGKAGKAAKVASPLTSKVLTRARFGPKEEGGRPIKTGNKTADAFRAREREIRGQVTPSSGGMFHITRPARQALADNLGGLRAVYPQVADRMEALGAARLEFLASKLPQRAGRTDTLLGGPDRWSPGPTAIAKFARYVAAAEDPAGIVERMVDARMTTEDAEVLRELYPSLYEAIQLDLTMRLPELRERLPRKKRLMLSILSGVPIEPGMDPRVLNRLQSHFAEEPGSEGGTQAPQAKPQFGSISAPEPTAAQERAG